MSSDHFPAEAPRAARAAVARSRRRRRRLLTTLAITTVIVAAAGYTIACAAAPLPALAITAAGEPVTEIVADSSGAQNAVDSQNLPTAIGWADGTEVWSNDDRAYTLGSISKLITVLVCLEERPFEPGTDGPTYTWTEYDRERQDYYLSLEGVAYPIPVGTEITQRQMFEFIFLPSSNDYAEAYANWVFGDNDRFLEALEAWKQEWGLDSITFVEPTGMEEENRASAADLVRVARIALENPTVREFNALKYADMPWGVGRIENTNPLLGVVPGVIGTKTGALGPVGYNFIASQEVNTLGRDLLNISVTLARPSKEQRAESGRTMLELMEPLPQRVVAVNPGEPVGSLTTWQGEQIELVTEGGAEAVLVPGESAIRTIEFQPPSSGPAGTRFGTLTVRAPAGSQEVAIVSTAPIAEPDLWWRLTHPAALFGGGAA